MFHVRSLPGSRRIFGSNSTPSLAVRGPVIKKFMGLATKPTVAISSAVWLMSGISFTAGITLALLWERKCHRRPKNDTARSRYDHVKGPHGDAYYLQRCHALRQSLSKPRHSQFRVVCLLLLDNGDCIMGANDEQAVSLGGALCAERGALLAYRTRYGGTTKPAPQIDCLYIVSDHPTMPLPPGCLCREYLYGHVDAIPDPRQTRIILQTSDVTSSPRIVTLEELYPFASVVARCRTLQDCMVRCERLQPQLAAWWHNHQHVHLTAHVDISWAEIRHLVYRAHQTALKCNARVHPLAYGAAAAVAIHGNQLHSVTAHQWTAQEYGCTQDAVCQLLGAVRQFVQDYESEDIFGVDRPTTAQIRAIVQVDAYGLPHAPFAPARSALVEFGFAEVPVVVATTTFDSSDKELLNLQVVRAVELVPYTPELPSSPLF